MEVINLSERKSFKINGFSLNIKIPDPKQKTGVKEGYVQTKEHIERKNESHLKLNEKTHTIIVEGIKNGLTKDRSCALANISHGTFIEWLKFGEQGRNPTYIKFYEAIKKAEVECEESCILVVRKAINGDIKSTKKKIVYSPDKLDPITNKPMIKEIEVVETKNAPSWTAAMTFMERKYPQRWGKYDRLTVEGDPNKPLISKEDMLSFLVGYVGKDNSPIDLKGRVVKRIQPQQIIDIPKKEEEDLLIENR